MKRFILPFLLIGTAVADTAQQKADQDLRLAEQRLLELKAELARERSVVFKNIEKLDDEVISQTKVLKGLLKAETDLSGGQRRLDSELSSRKGEFEYTLSTLKGYGAGIKNRIHSAEKQGFGAVIEEQRKKADAAQDDLVIEIQERLSVLHLAAERMVAISGGQRFDGEAVGDGNTVKDGKFAVAGPLGYFASDDGEVVGFTGLAAEGVNYPNTAPVKEGGEGIIALVKTGAGVVPVDASMGKAIQVARTQKSIGDYLKGGGFVGYGILGIGLLAVLIAILKVIEINRFPIPNRKKLNLIIDDLLAHKPEDARSKGKEIKGFGGELVLAGVEYFYDKRRILEDALLEKLGMIQPRLERFLPFLALVAAAAPMMGLLGTVLGIMKTFAMMSAGGSGDSKSFSAGISEALITTAMGLIVAIPVIIVHGMLKSFAKSKFGQAEGVALSILNGTTELVGSPNPPAEDEGDDVDEAELAPA